MPASSSGASESAPHTAVLEAWLHRAEEFYDVEGFASRRDFSDQAATYQYRFNLTRKNF